MARLALKALARGQWPKGAAHTNAKCWYEPLEDRETAELALRFTLNQDVTAAIPPGDERLFRLALDLASGSLPPLSAEEQKTLLVRANGLDPVFTA